MENKNIETQVAESVFDAFGIIFGTATGTDRDKMLGELESVSIEGEQIGRILLGVLVAVSGLQESFTGEEMSIEETAQMMVVLADAFVQATEGDA